MPLSHRVKIRTLAALAVATLGSACGTGSESLEPNTIQYLVGIANTTNYAVVLNQAEYVTDKLNPQFCTAKGMRVTQPGQAYTLMAGTSIYLCWFEIMAGQEVNRSVAFNLTLSATPDTATAVVQGNQRMQHSFGSVTQPNIVGGASNTSYVAWSDAGSYTRVLTMTPWKFITEDTKNSTTAFASQLTKDMGLDPTQGFGKVIDFAITKGIGIIMGEFASFDFSNAYYHMTIADNPQS